MFYCTIIIPSYIKTGQVSTKYTYYYKSSDVVHHNSCSVTSTRSINFSREWDLLSLLFSFRLLMVHTVSITWLLQMIVVLTGNVLTKYTAMETNGILSPFWWRFFLKNEDRINMFHRWCMHIYIYIYIYDVLYY